MLFSRTCALIAIGGLLSLLHSDLSEAQIVRRYARGGVQIRAPFVRVNVGPGGATSVRAPFTAVDSLGGVYVGPRRRWLAQPQYAPAPTLAPAMPGPQPTPVHVDELAYPTHSELAAMDDVALVETLREMMARFHYRLSLLNTGKGWQDYLVLSREKLGSPGAPPEAVEILEVQKVLARYGSVQENPRYTKVSTLPSFGATFAALIETENRFGSTQPVGPEIVDPSIGQPAPVETPTERVQEILPQPLPDELPNARRGERSILRKK